MIPRIVHFIWFGSKDHPRAEEYEENRRSFAWFNPSWQVIHWTEDLIRRRFDMGYIDSLSSSYAKSDYIRLLILFEIGGVYLDQDVISFSTLPPGCFDEDMLNMPSLCGSPTKVNNCMMAVKRGHPVLMDLMREGKRRYASNSLGRLRQYVSLCWGPDMFNEVLSTYGSSIHMLSEEILFDHHSGNCPATHQYCLFHRSLVGWRLDDKFGAL